MVGAQGARKVYGTRTGIGLVDMVFNDVLLLCELERAVILLILHQTFFISSIGSREYGVSAEEAGAPLPLNTVAGSLAAASMNAIAVCWNSSARACLWASDNGLSSTTTGICTPWKGESAKTARSE